ncbi:MAG: hypothetical protein JSU04_11430 [Bdellovibrionales bacterium]|nr:hypothetical protein [Bdellovibrionales bacterium]
MKKTLFVLCALAMQSISAYAGQAPLEIKEFLLNSVPAKCAYVFLAKCDSGFCYGEPEAFFFGIKGKVPQNPQGHSFENYSSDNEIFKTQFSISENNNLETLRMSLYREAWAPALPDNDGRNLGVTKFEYTIAKRVSDGKIIFAEETEFVKKRNIFGSLAKTWKVNTAPQTCKDN